jgi:sigma-E factor negative regulatory protein RseA
VERAQACSVWRADAQARAQWHAWHLIGDVMRSDDLASTAAHDAAFLHRLREKLQQEPVVMAPARWDAADRTVTPQEAPVAEDDQAHWVVRTVAQPQVRRRWAASAAVAAGFMVVAGALVVLRTGAPGSGEELNQIAGAGAAGRAVDQRAPIPEQPPQVVRNPELDRYLAAHRQFAQGPSLAAPGGLRQVVVSPDAR